MGFCEGVYTWPFFVSCLLTCSLSNLFIELHDCSIACYTRHRKTSIASFVKGSSTVGKDTLQLKTHDPDTEETGRTGRIRSTHQKEAMA